MSSAVRSRSTMLPAVKAMGNITEFDGEQPAAAGRARLGFAEQRVAQAEEVTGLVRGNGLHVEAARFPAGRDGPLERRVEEDVGLENLAGARVDEERRRGQRAFEVGTGRKPDHVGAVLIERAAADEPAELEADRRRLDGLPGIEAAADGLAKLRRRHAVDAAVADEVPHRRARGPLQADGAAVHARAQLQVRVRGRLQRGDHRQAEQHAASRATRSPRPPGQRAHFLKKCGERRGPPAGVASHDAHRPERCRCPASGQSPASPGGRPSRRRSARGRRPAPGPPGAGWRGRSPRETPRPPRPRQRSARPA